MAIPTYDKTVQVFYDSGVSVGLPVVGGTIKLKLNGIEYTGTELGATNGVYLWSDLDAGRYELIVNGVTRGEVIQVGSGEWAGLGWTDARIPHSTGTLIEYKTYTEVKTLLSLDQVNNVAIPVATGADVGKILEVDATGAYVLTTQSGSSGVIGSGTVNYLPIWTSSGEIGNSPISHSGSTLTIGVGINVTEVLPELDSLANLGSNTVRWNDGYFDDLYTDGITGDGGGVISGFGSLSVSGAITGGDLTCSAMTLNSQAITDILISTDGASTSDAVLVTPGWIDANVSGGGGFWQRVGTTLSPATAGDNVSIGGTLDVNGNITLGDASGDSHTINGNAFFAKDGTGQFWQNGSGTNRVAVVWENAADRLGFATYEDAGAFRNWAFEIDRSSTGDVTIGGTRNLVVPGNASFSGNVTLGDASDDSTTFSNVGSLNAWAGGNTYARFGHKDLNTTDGYGFVQGPNGDIGIESKTGQTIALYAGNTLTCTMTGANTSFGGIVNLGTATTDPTGTNGDIYYNTTNNKFRKFENGAWFDWDASTTAICAQETFPEALATTAISGFDGAYGHITAFNVCMDMDVNEITAFVIQTAGSGSVYFAIYDSSFNLIEDTSGATPSTAGYLTQTLQSTVSLTAGTKYYAFIGGTSNGCTFLGATGLYNNSNRAKQDLNSTTPPASFSGSSDSKAFWLSVSKA